MLLLCFAAIYVVAVCAESPSIGSYNSQGGSLRDYEYTSGRSGESYLGAKPSYGEFAGGSYISLTGAPYSKGETRYTSTSDSNSESSDTRTSLTSASSGSDGGSNSASNNGGSFYKAKYASDASINAIRPSYQSLPGSSLAAPTSSATYEETALQGQNSGYTSSVSQSTGPSSSYYGHEQQLQPASHSEYASSQGRPSASVYPGYAANAPTGEYVHSRPSSYNFGGLPSAASQMAMSDYPSGSRHHVHASYPVSDEPSYQGHAGSAPAPHPYKSYIVSNPPSSYSSSKYQTVLGALKSLFGGGNAGTTEAAVSPSHPPSYLGYYSPVHSASHHAPALMSPLTSVASPSSHYFSPGSATSNSPYSTAYSKNYPPMRLMSSYGLHSGSSGSSGSPGGPSSPGSPGKIILVRDGSTAHGANYPSAAASLLPSPKTKISAYSSVGPSYISAAPSSLSYSTTYTGTYPGSAAFPSTHGGSTFLGYSAN